jgi:parallel beta-helix repeat protein
MKKRLLICTFSVTLGILLIFTVFCFGSTQQVIAASTGVTRYVSTSGSDIFNDCTNSVFPCSTIQHAINQSGFGDSIQVASGTYGEHITLKDGVSIYGQGWDYTTIDGGFTLPTSTVYIPSSVSASTVLSGVKVMRGGRGSPGINPNGGGLSVYGSASIVNTWVYSCTGEKGGGVYVNGGSPTFNNVPVWSSSGVAGGGFFIENNAVVTVLGNPLAGTNGTVLMNSAGYDGGGFYLGNATVTLIGLRIYGNSAETGGGLYIGQNPNKITLWLNDISANRTSFAGGGMKVYKATNLDMFGNFIGNKVPLVGGNSSVGDGGGVFFQQSAGSVRNNWFIGNRSDEGYGGAAAFCYSSPNLILSGNWFEGNSAYMDGGGLSIFGNADPQLDANTIMSNTANWGGGIDISEAGQVKITNNLIARNVSTATSPIVGGIYVFKSPVQIINNTIADNTGDGVWFENSDNIAIVNNLIYGNTDDSIQGDTPYDTTIFTVDYNDMFNNTYNAYNDVSSGAHDLQIDPLIKATGDVFSYYHLRLTSPVNTTGSPAWAPPRDIDNQVRACGGKVSMGADQVPCSVYLPMLNR